MSRIIITANVAGECVCDHNPCDGLDCGVFLPGQQPRKRPALKTPEQMADIRARAWETRRTKYGQYGHR